MAAPNNTDIEGAREPSSLNGVSRDCKQVVIPYSLINSDGEQCDNIVISSWEKKSSKPHDKVLMKSGSGPPSPVDPSHKPSYLKLSCAVSGYGKYSHYSTYTDVAKRSPSLNQISLRSNLSSSSPSLLIGQIPRSVSTSEYITRPRPSGCNLAEDRNNSPVIVVNGHISKHPTGDAQKDGEYLLLRMQFEKERIEGLCLQTEADLRSHDLPEEASGRMRAAIGKANLLLSQKFVQFMDLCHNYVQPNPDERETKWEDLEGFWDMVKIQIDNVDDMFVEIEMMKHRGWQEIPKMASRRSSTSSSPQSGNISQSSTPAATPSHTPGSKRKTLTTSVSKDTPESSPERTEKARQAAKARDEARKKMLLERRAAMKQTTSTSNIQEPGVEIFLPEQTKK